MTIDPTTALPSKEGIDLEGLYRIAKENEEKFWADTQESFAGKLYSDSDVAAYSLRIERAFAFFIEWRAIRRAYAEIMQGYESLNEEIAKCQQ